MSQRAAHNAYFVHSSVKVAHLTEELLVLRASRFLLRGSLRAGRSGIWEDGDGSAESTGGIGQAEMSGGHAFARGRKQANEAAAAGT